MRSVRVQLCQGGACVKRERAERAGRCVRVVPVCRVESVDKCGTARMVHVLLWINRSRTEPESETRVLNGNMLVQYMLSSSQLSVPPSCLHSSAPRHARANTRSPRPRAPVRLNCSKGGDVRSMTLDRRTSINLAPRGVRTVWRGTVDGSFRSRSWN
jgi:hypothetical protein